MTAAIPPTDIQHGFEWSERLQDWLDGELAAADGAAVEEHLAGCARCRAAVAKLRALDHALHGTAPRIALDEKFDERVLAQIEAIDEDQRACARQRIEQELQQDLQVLTRGWRRALALMLPGIAAAMAIAFALTAWAADSGFAHWLVAQSAAELGRDAAQLVRWSLTALLGMSLGLLLARWLASTAE